MRGIGFAFGRAPGPGPARTRLDERRPAQRPGDDLAVGRDLGLHRAAHARFVLLVLATCHAGVAVGQESQPGSASGDPSELPPAVLAELDTLNDFAFDFDRPAFYALLRHVRDSPHPPGHAQDPVVVETWRDFAERPRDFRGVAVTVEGVVGANRGYELIRHRDFGRLWQLELSGTQPQACACTVICTEPADDVPLGATVRVTGYFVMMRSYVASSQRTQTAALLVAAGPTRVAAGAARREERPPAAALWSWLIAPLALGLLLAWILLRRAAAGRRRTDLRELNPRPAAPQSLSDDLARWAESDERLKP